MDEFYKKYEPFFGSWYIKNKIGEGNFGKVFEIERKDFNNCYKAALKAITIPQNQSEVDSVMADGMDISDATEYFRNFVQQIVNEFVLMSKLKGNSNVVSYEDHMVLEREGEIGWDIFIRMELLTPLLSHIKTNPLTRKDVIKLGIDICRALELCQKYNIIHRDIKPENIFVSPNYDFKLGDFGIARQIEKTTSGLSKKGTYAYMAPEVYKGEAYGSTVDIYSLGIVMYRLLNENRLPFLPSYPAPITHDDRENALVKRMSGTKIPNPVNVDGRLLEIVMKAISYNPKDRYSSPKLMRDELEAILYSKEEARIIYPQGDDVEIKSIEYISTGKKSFFSGKNGKGRKKESTGMSNKTEVIQCDGNILNERTAVIQYDANVSHGRTEIIQRDGNVLDERTEILDNTPNLHVESHRENRFIKSFLNSLMSNKRKVVFAACVLACVIFGVVYSVTPKKVLVTAISGVNDNIELTEGDTYRLNPNVEPKDASNRVINYSVSDMNFAEIKNDGNILAKKEGTTYVILKVGAVEKKVALNIKKKIMPTVAPAQAIFTPTTAVEKPMAVNSLKEAEAKLEVKKVDDSKNQQSSVSTAASKQNLPVQGQEVQQNQSVSKVEEVKKEVKSETVVQSTSVPQQTETQQTTTAKPTLPPPEIYVNWDQ